jgi:tRNA pseudouridine38-40 synthase
MPSRLRFVVAYDGAPFAGWQSQKNGNTIQDHLERAFAIVGKQAVRVHGAGRTDAGVHALAQSAHADVPEQTLTPEQWTSALNASLPPTIRVLRSRYVGARFHARFSVIGKIYRYRIWNDRILPPLENGRAWHVPMPLDVAAMQREAEAFVGRHDFASFAANRGKPGEDTIRTIDSIRLARAGKCVALEFSGDGFLYKMVRLMVGALIRRGRGQTPHGEIERRLQTPAATLPTARLVAPAGGLFLVRVRY